MSEKEHPHVLDLLHELADSFDQFGSCWERGQVDSVRRAVGLAGCITVHSGWIVETEVLGYLIASRPVDTLAVVMDEVERDEKRGSFESDLSTGFCLAALLDDHICLTWLHTYVPTGMFTINQLILDN